MSFLGQPQIPTIDLQFDFPKLIFLQRAFLAAEKESAQAKSKLYGTVCAHSEGAGEKHV
jgi:hypothetical protein